MITSTFYILPSNFPWEGLNKHPHVLFIFVCMGGLSWDTTSDHSSKEKSQCLL